MTKTKMKSSAERRSSYQKPTLRSEAFARAVRKAKLRVVGSGGLRSLFEQAARKAASLPRHQFKENWPYLQTMLRLIGAYERGEYKQVSNDDLMWIVAALNYLINPFDLIISGCGTFPPHGRPKVLWIGVFAGSAGFVIRH